MYYCQFFSLFNFKRVGACEHIYIKKYCKKLPLTLSLTTVFNLYSEQCWSFIAPSRLFRRHFSRGNMEYMYFFNTIHIGSTRPFYISICISTLPMQHILIVRVVSVRSIYIINKFLAQCHYSYL